ncbi:MAG: FKBP-type peptidyl-prolyl cis-trans isomerase [Nannocystaceae bacterium]
MKIASGTVVTLSFDISTSSGEIVESSSISGPITFLHGRGGLLPGLDRRLEGMRAGDAGTFELQPTDAFGEVDDAPIKTIPRGELPDGAVAVGGAFEAKMPGGQSVTLNVIEVGEQDVKARIVHPLAGQVIGVSVKVMAVREATRAEQQGGRVVTSPPPPPPRH